jgi:AcrR family transcriptional regulator
VSTRTPDPPPPTTRAAQKEQTRQRLLHAAHAQLAHQGFTSLSLREVTRAAGVVPAAFYRHFADLDELGLALVAQSFGALREAARAARADSGGALSNATSGEVLRLLRYSREHRDLFRFIARERVGGSAVLRAAIAREMALFESDLAVDLARAPALAGWDAADIRLLASLLAAVMTRAVEDVVDTEDEAVHLAVERRVLRQLDLIGAGVRGWGG